jgi:hypothetical protein
VPDFPYDITAVKNGYCEQALWNAVYFKLTPEDTHSKPEKMIRAVQKRWRLAASKLKKEGWEPMQGVNVQYARNCPPLGCTTDQTGRPCKKGKLCPFCWGRRIVYKVYHRVHDAAFATKGSTSSKPELDVMEFAYTGNFDTVEDAIGDIAKNRTSERDQVQHLGSAVVITVVPKEVGVMVRRRGILVAPRGTGTPDNKNGCRWTLPGVIDKSYLAKCVGYATRYPEELMREKDLARTIEFLTALDGVRLCSFSGTMYRQT